MGHTSLLVEDALGIWWFTYWGDKYIAIYPYGNGTVSQFKSFINWGFDPRPYRNYYVNVYYDGTFENMMYFKGDFSSSLSLYISAIMSQDYSNKYIRDQECVLYSNGNKFYNLLINNCVQSCLDALNMGIFYYSNHIFKLSYLNLRNRIVPNIVYGELSVLMPWSLIISNDWYL